MVCACGFYFSSGSPLPGGAGLQFIIGGLLGKNLLKRGWYAKNLGKIYFFRQSHAIMALTRGFGFKNKDFGRFFRANKPKNLFATRVVKVAT